MFFFILVVVLTPAQAYTAFLLYLLAVFVLIRLAKIPLKVVFKQSLIIVAMVLMVAFFSIFKGSLEQKLLLIFNVTAKAWLCLLASILLTASTPFELLLKGAQSLRVPQVLITLLSFTYRFLFLISEEVSRMQKARKLRDFGNSRLKHLKTIGHIAGNLFVRSYERGERVYQAMLLRAFKGEINTYSDLRFMQTDVGFILITTGIMLPIFIFSILFTTQY